MSFTRTLLAGALGLTAALVIGEAVAADPERLPPLAKPKDVDSEAFSTSGTCALCHAGSDGATAMKDAKGRSVAPYDLWQSTMMANSSRDPLWRAVVSAEVAATPNAKAAIEQKCMRCHAPLASAEARHFGVEIGMDLLYDDSAEAQLALDGVSCSMCHTIDPKNLGEPESFSGHYVNNRKRVIYGPHADPVPGPMRMHVSMTPRQGDHVRKSSLCATCHTLYTDSLDAEGKKTGHRLPEQTPYLEWQNSVFNDEGGKRGVSCQGCHVPTRDAEGKPIETRIAHAPFGGDFPFLEPRQPFGRHVFVGANTLVPAILRDNAGELNPRASKEAFEATIAAAREQLSKRTARLKLAGVERAEGVLRASVSVQSFVGHKFPTGHPARRAWLQLVVSDASGKVLFASGAHDEAGRLVAGGKVLAADQAGGPFHPHRQVIRRADEVAVYESVMGDAEGAPTYLLLRGASYLKDNRLLPRGWSAEHSNAKDTAPVGVAKDKDFSDAGDTVRYEVKLPEGAKGPLRVQARLLYQVLGARYADELFRYDTPEVAAFRRYWEKAERRPEVVAEAEQTLP